MIRIHLNDGTHLDTTAYSLAAAKAALADGADIEVGGLEHADEPLGTRLIGPAQIARIEDLG